MSKGKLWGFTIGLLAVEWFVFKIAYPFPDVFADSYYYMYAARDHLDINLWPIGYSKFLALFHAITHSALALVTFQFFALELSAMALFLRIRKFRMSQAVMAVIYIFFFVNPLLLYQSNTITSDALFGALTLLWLTELLKFLEKPPTFARLWPQAILIGVGYTFRYTASYYPIISALALFISQASPLKKVLGSLFFLLFLVPFLQYSRQAGERLTGVPMTSILGGWQIGNNALHMRAQIQPGRTKLPNQACERLDSICRDYFSKEGPNIQDFLDHYKGNYFIQGDWNTPLKVYMTQTYHSGTFREWGLSGITIGQYGKYLIRHYPWAYLRYFIIPNAGFYFYPPLTDIKSFNGGSEVIGEDMRQWFGLTSRYTPVYSTTLQGSILEYFPVVFLALNIAFTLLYVASLFRRTVSKAIHLIAAYWALNAAFSILANRPCLRYEIVPMLVLWAFTAVLFDKLEVPTSTDSKTPRSPTPSPHSPNQYTPV